MPFVLMALLALAAPEQQYQERITVERILIDARVTDSHGNPITGLKPADFRVRVDGKAAMVESVDWIPETAAERELAEMDKPQPEVNTTLSVPAPRGRLFIFFFQTDFARNTARVTGQMDILQRIDAFLDFLARLDPQVMKDARDSSEALLIIGNALRPIPGPKSLILFGWGLGTLHGGRVWMERSYPAARQALEGARVSVFSLDFTQADAHSLSVGLGQVSGDTGGFYASTFRFPNIAIERLHKTLAGHYELEVRKPDTKIRGLHTIEVDVDRRGAEVMARSTYVDRD